MPPTPHLPHPLTVCIVYLRRSACVRKLRTEGWCFIWVERTTSSPDWQNRTGSCSTPSAPEVVLVFSVGGAPCPRAANRMLVSYLLSHELFYPSQLHSLEASVPCSQTQNISQSRVRSHAEFHKDVSTINHWILLRIPKCGSWVFTNQMVNNKNLFIFI